jgi:penicillin amidase
LTTTGEIGYATTGKFPMRNYKVVQGSYTKLGFMDENVWTGIVPHNELPYVINPEKGYIVSANNFITSDKAFHGISHSFVFPHRAVRIAELIDEMAAK